MIEVESVTKRYGQTAVVDRVSLTIPKGGVTSFIGPNGAGKSTLLSMISRLMPMDEGRIRIDGMDVGSTPSDVMARKLAILRQDNPMSLRLTVRDLIAFGRFPHSKGRLTAQDVGHIDHALEMLELTALADRYLDEISGGQRQRAFVAMVMCQDTDYILLDEPLNNLDMHHGVAMMRLLRNFADTHGKTVVVVIHDINFASAYSDCIVAMKNGQLDFMGTPEELVRPEVLQPLYELDIDVHEINGQRICVYYR
ncbi:ABC transporter ATP-binding protein [Lampropedia puyangensis]|uniref:ABC transporter ATP-binding protein n=1 Tax=Lampropedia puyangensis TaxID=1330072 RepID=A0A4S8F058_9BURK|nr:ABC transporter ATP-binding protein [Lampropedia puyangensis]THU00630.1 ABC transporter ATP-binding protein [Lampropedia puyangensis]